MIIVPVPAGRNYDKCERQGGQGSGQSRERHGRTGWCASVQYYGSSCSLVSHHHTAAPAPSTKHHQALASTCSCTRIRTCTLRVLLSSSLVSLWHPRRKPITGFCHTRNWRCCSTPAAAPDCLSSHQINLPSSVLVTITLPSCTRPNEACRMGITRSAPSCVAVLYQLLPRVEPAGQHAPRRRMPFWAESTFMRLLQIYYCLTLVRPMGAPNRDDFTHTPTAGAAEG